MRARIVWLIEWFADSWLFEPAIEIATDRF